MSHGRPPALVTTWCKVEKWEADSGEMCDAQTCVRTPAFMFSPPFSLVSDNCHGHRATRLVKAIPCCVHGRADMQPALPARVCCCLSKSVAVGRVHHRSEVLTGGIMLDTALLVVASFPFWNKQAFYIYQKSPSKTKFRTPDIPPGKMVERFGFVLSGCEPKPVRFLIFLS